MQWLLDLVTSHLEFPPANILPLNQSKNPSIHFNIFIVECKKAYLSKHALSVIMHDKLY